MSRRSRPALDRLLERVVEHDGCWVVTRGLTSEGYGQVSAGKGVTLLAHRVVWEHVVGAIPTGRQIDHLCRNRACCNPAHLELVTRRENILRGASDAATNARKTHCPRGHALTQENLVPAEVRRGRRACLICKREQARRHMRKSREAALARLAA